MVPIRVVRVRVASELDIPAIIAFLVAYGGGNVDLRDRRILKRAIDDGTLYVFEDEGGTMVGTGGAFSYCGGCLIELGCSAWAFDWRHLGGAYISVLLRSLMAALTIPKSTCVSELYFKSTASAHVLAGCGFVEVEPSDAMHRHASEISPEPVRHMALPLSALPEVARRVLSFIDAPYVHKGTPTLRVKIAPGILIATRSGRSQAEALAAGDLSMAGWSALPNIDATPTWMGCDHC